MGAFHNFVLKTPEGLNIIAMDEIHGKNEIACDFGGIFGRSSKNHDKIPTTYIRCREML